METVYRRLHKALLELDARPRRPDQPHPRDLRPPARDRTELDRRIARTRAQADGTLWDRLDPRAARVNARELVQVTTGGTLPSCTPCVYLGNPVLLDGAETEGGLATANVDTTRTIPFVLTRGTAAIGDVLPIHGVGGRWVGELDSGSSSGSGFPCGGCSMPRQNLTVSYSNILFGNGEAPLVYTGTPTTQWLSACTNQLLYEIVCTQNQVEFRVYLFVSGSCPSGQSQYCSTIRSNPFGLTQTTLTCSPFLLTCTVSSATCPNLASNGYTDFTISQ